MPTGQQSHQTNSEKPMFWLNKWRYNRGLSKENQLDWIKALVVLYIKNVIKIGHFVDVPCYINNDVMTKATEISFEEALQQNDAGVLQILAPRALARTDNAPNLNLFEVLQLSKNHPEKLQVEVIKTLAPLIENLNSPDTNGITPIHHASNFGQFDVIRFLAPLTKNPNAPDKNEVTPIYIAAHEGHLDVIKLLAPLTETPNATAKNGWTPIHIATFKGYLDVIRFLVPLTDSANAPNENGKTPIDYASSSGYDEITQFLQSYIRN